MSICLAQNTLSPAAQTGWFVGCLLLTVVIGTLIGAYKPSSVLGPQRLTFDQPLWPILVSGVIAGFTWLGLQIVVIVIRAAELMRTHPGQAIDIEKQLTARDYALLATVPFLIGFALMLILDRVLDRRLLGSIGLTWPRAPRGLLTGFGSVFVVFPLMICSALIVEQLYRAIGYKHPEAHELLAAMKNTDVPLIRAALIFGAVIGAPFFEEYLFRGHLQTFLVRLFTPGPRPVLPVPLPPAPLNPVAHLAPPPLPGQPVAPPPAAADPLIYENPPDASNRRSSIPAWSAILITSFLFAIIHPLWTAPLIFVLAVCLGYAYERTGNLWVPITIHALFNGLNTIEYLYFY